MSNPKEYTIGWISALSIEYTAARLFLDREHDPPEPDQIATTDNNTYTLGEIAGHKIVIAVLPHGEYGTTTAASVATNMLHSFPNIRVALMVGIGGGAPTAEHDIRLGDVVVSCPKDGKGGVYQYDYGKRIQGCEFKPTGHLNQPPSVVLTAISKLKSDYDLDGHQIDETIKSILEKRPRLKKNYSRPPPDTDVLYASHIVHPVHESTSSCTEVCMEQSSEVINERKRAASEVESLSHTGKKRCGSPGLVTDVSPLMAMYHQNAMDQVSFKSNEAQQSRTVSRSERGIEDDIPAIHYGPIASGNSLMKDALMRDDLANKEGILCFEMEAAGIMNNLPCLVIRGTCDYSDSHKNKKWQGYAAMTAAAYTRDLLRVMLPKKVEKERELTTFLERLSNQSTAIQNILETSWEQQQAYQIRKWLSPSDPSIILENILERRHRGTCRWLLDSDDYQAWRTAQSSFFWLYGLSGCGKTVLASSVIHQLRTETPQPRFAFFYFDINGGGRQDISQMLRSILYQLCSEQGEDEPLLKLYANCGMGTREPTLHQMSEMLASILDRSNEVAVVIDALDECALPSDALDWLKNLHRDNHKSLHLLVTSRKHGALSAAIDNWPQRDQVHAVRIAEINRDIAHYVHVRLFESEEFAKWSSHEGLQAQVKDTVLQQANGMFRLAACQLDDLRPCIDRPRLMTALQTLPTTLQEIYERILVTLRDSHCFREALFMLQYVLWSETPPDFSELIDAIAVRLDESPGFKQENRLFELMDVVTQCSSLLTIVNKSNNSDDERRQEIHLSHSSVKEYLLSSCLASPFDQLLSETHARACIAKTCIRYIIDTANLQYELLENPSGPMELLDVSIFPFARPANLWTHHAKVVEGMDNDVVRLVSELYAQKRLIHKFPDLLSLGLSCKFGLFEYTHVVDPSKLLDAPHPLIHACYWGLESVARCMLDAGTGANLRGYLDSPLHAASYSGHYILVTSLLERGAILDGYAEHPVPLLGASRNGHVEVVRILLQYGARIDAHDSDHRTAMEIAASRGHQNVVRLLLNANGHYPLRFDVHELAILEATKNRHVEVVRLLAQHVDHSSKSRSKTLISALTAAVGHGCDEIISLLLQNGAYDHACLNSAAALAIKERLNSTLKLLLVHGADPLGCRNSCKGVLVRHSEEPNLLSIALEQWPVDDQIVEFLYSELASTDESIHIEEIEQTLWHLLENDKISYADALLGKLVDLHINPLDFGTRLLELLHRQCPKLAKILLNRSLQSFPGIDGEVTLSFLKHHIETMVCLRRRFQSINRIRAVYRVRDRFVLTRPRNQMAEQKDCNYALQSYHMELMLAEQYNKKRLLMARQEQDKKTTQPSRPTPASDQYQNFAPAASSMSSRASPSPRPEQ